ncbi:sigma-70 family RNA polymerase sigma factor [Lutibaculum baratangense]|uniref:RNA polymerase, sigma-24 subunit, ECF subfamily n=1 Tax=Lutibaculum baratangense AMV1 TaxID=631454 RepID=V4T7B1_9HYPH|nr:sigma-70 family RNA polymerase sigma factor [Lutibaculum baratangense]ESR22508.1 RNA polymerase, sigma-24 subunit, ECF subfamily [Lutibaculum baratangense AMV1]
MNDDLKWMIERQIPHLRRYAIALTRNRDHADDLVQDALERALRKRHLWSRSGRLRSWLFRILYRTYVDGRRRFRPEKVPAEPGTIDGMATQPPDQEHRVECRNIAAALDRLPDEQREVVLLSALEGMQYDEMADVLDVPIGTVRSRLSRGRETLRRVRDAEEGPARLRRVK